VKWLINALAGAFTDALIQLNAAMQLYNFQRQEMFKKTLGACVAVRKRTERAREREREKRESV